MLPALKIDILRLNGCGCQCKICNIGKQCLKLLLFICGVEFWEPTIQRSEKIFYVFRAKGFLNAGLKYSLHRPLLLRISHPHKWTSGGSQKAQTSSASAASRRKK